MTYLPAERLVESLRWAIGYIDGLKKFDPNEKPYNGGDEEHDWLEWASAHDWLKDADFASQPTPEEAVGDGPASPPNDVQAAKEDVALRLARPSAEWLLEECAKEGAEISEEDWELLATTIRYGLADGPASPVLGDEGYPTAAEHQRLLNERAKDLETVEAWKAKAENTRATAKKAVDGIEAAASDIYYGGEQERAEHIQSAIDDARAALDDLQEES